MRWMRREDVSCSTIPPPFPLSGLCISCPRRSGGLLMHVLKMAVVVIASPPLRSPDGWYLTHSYDLASRCVERGSPLAWCIRLGTSPRQAGQAAFTSGRTQDSSLHPCLGSPHHSDPFQPSTCLGGAAVGTACRPPPRRGRSWLVCCMPKEEAESAWRSSPDSALLSGVCRSGSGPQGPA
ncbi:hypothetical protein B0T14DRAFT_10962 [Immersiella caudata]|uniref:Uncharacterized protein n=1 Tax=Immersiella caudata TaxID=314043 RepID=A0AA39XD62_9PEZI|nr:hypothetical protein B0T14DRAFT_10962 [Immersiella caudata]